MADEHDIVIDEDGAPALRLAGAVVIDPNAKSGNPAHEVHTGRFGSHGARRPGKAPTSRRKVAPVDDGSAERRRDAVVDAARSISELTPDGVREFVRRRWRGTRALTEDDVGAFAVDAQRQRIEDVVDALDLRLRKAVYNRGGSKVVKIDFPRGMLRSTMKGLESDQVIAILNRLRERGWTEEQVGRYVVRPFRLRDAKK